MFRSGVCAALVFCLAAVGYTPRADAFIFGELKQLGRAVIGTVKGVGRDLRGTGQAVKEAFTPNRSPTQKHRREYEKRMSKEYREQRRELRRAERYVDENPSDEEAAKLFEERVEKAEKRMRQASRRHEEMTRENRRLSKKFGASDQGPSTKLRNEYLMFVEERESRQEERRTKIGDFRNRNLSRR